jgi:hypothetical protein
MNGLRHTSLNSLGTLAHRSFNTVYLYDNLCFILLITRKAQVYQPLFMREYNPEFSAWLE